MTKQISPLVQDALALLSKDNKEVTEANISEAIVRSHAPKCSKWKELNIEFSQLVEYVQYCTAKLNMSNNMHCEAIVVLHEYLRLSHHVFPKTTEQLSTFNQCGVVPTENLHLLTSQLIPQTTQCAMCKCILSQGTNAFCLPCGHWCCCHLPNEVSRTTCDVKTRLRISIGVLNVRPASHLVEGGYNPETQ